MIISGGVNIYPAEIEAVIAEHDGVADVSVIGVPNEEFGEEVKAIVECSNGYIGDEDLFERYCNCAIVNWQDISDQSLLTLLINCLGQELERF